MTIDELKKLHHINEVKHGNMLTFTTDEGYYLHAVTSSSTTSSVASSGQSKEEQIQHIIISSISCQAKCEAIPDYEIINTTEKLRFERSIDFHGMSVEEVKSAIINEITDYDASPLVNGFILNGSSVWLDKATRVGLMNSTTIAKAMGNDTTTLWFEGMKIEIKCDKAIQLLSSLEMYALDCFNVTSAHKQTVQGLTTIDDIITYDYTVGYPEKLEMTI